MKRILLRTSFLVATLLLAACATTGRQSEVAAPQVEFTIENNLVPGRSVDVRIVSSSGIRRRLGQVSPSSTRRISFSDASYAGEYQLTAETSTGGDLISQPFNLFAGAQITWDLRNNLIAVYGF